MSRTLCIYARVRASVRGGAGVRLACPALAQKISAEAGLDRVMIVLGLLHLASFPDH